MEDMVIRLLLTKNLFMFVGLMLRSQRWTTGDALCWGGIYRRESFHLLLVRKQVPMGEQPFQQVGRSNRMCPSIDGGLPHNPVSEPGGAARISRNNDSAKRGKKARDSGRSVERSPINATSVTLHPLNMVNWSWEVTPERFLYNCQMESETRAVFICIQLSAMAVNSSWGNWERGHLFE